MSEIPKWLGLDEGASDDIGTQSQYDFHLGYPPQWCGIAAYLPGT